MPEIIKLKQGKEFLEQVLKKNHVTEQYDINYRKIMHLRGISTYVLIFFAKKKHCKENLYKTTLLPPTHINKEMRKQKTLKHWHVSNVALGVLNQNAT
jgi:hypothetical protein